MSAKRTAEPSPESVARANRQRLAQEEGVRALADMEKQSAEIRKNMQRLRTLREAKLAEEIG
ncbi:MAG: transcriptional regulator, partial [Bradyrhizobium sp.]|nr:transcriptional regulator [Bradyrhizobium sp.]